MAEPGGGNESSTTTEGGGDLSRGPVRHRDSASSLVRFKLGSGRHGKMNTFAGQVCPIRRLQGHSIHEKTKIQNLNGCRAEVGAAKEEGFHPGTNLPQKASHGSGKPPKLV